ncbi:MAG: hypothetical protein RSB50_08185 [Cetobacterium sp.]
MDYPNYASTADIEVINNNIKKLVKNAEEQDTQIKSKVSKSGDIISGTLVASEFVSNQYFKIKDYYTGTLTADMWVNKDQPQFSPNTLYIYNIENLFLGSNLKVYHTGFKPTKTDIGLGEVENYVAVKKAGDTMTGSLRSNVNHMLLYKGTHKGIYASEGAIGFTTSTNAWTFYARESDNASIAMGEIYAQSDKRVYHTAFKPTKADVGLDLVNNWDASSAVNDPSNSKYATSGAVKKAYDKAVEANTNADNKVSKAGDTMTGSLRSNVNHMLLYKDTHKGIYASEGAIGFTTSTNAWTFYARESDNASIAMGEIYAQSDKRVYHTAFKPTKADVGLDLVNNWDASSAVNDPSNSKYATSGAVKKAYDKAIEANTNADNKVSKAGDTMSGTLRSTINNIISYKNTDKGIYASEAAIGFTTASNEWAFFIRDSDNASVSSGEIYANGDQKVYHPNNKPTPSDIGAVKKTGDTMTGDLNVPNITATQYMYLKDYYGSDSKCSIWYNKERASWRSDTVYLGSKDLGFSDGSIALNSRNSGIIKETLFSGTIYKNSPALLTKPITDFDLIYCFSGDTQDMTPSIFLPEDMLRGNGNRGVFQCNYSDTDGCDSNVRIMDLSYFKMESPSSISCAYIYSGDKYIPDAMYADIKVVGIKFGLK